MHILPLLSVLTFYQCFFVSIGCWQKGRISYFFDRIYMELLSKRIFLFDGFNRFQSRPCLSQQMLDCLPRSVNQHPGTGKAHHPSHLFPHGGFVAVYAALLACFLFLPEGTVVQAGVCIVQQLFAPGAKRDILFFLRQ